MLTDNDYIKIDKRASKLFAQLELDIIKEIAERIGAVGEANTVVYNNVAILQEMGVLYQDIVDLVAKYNNENAEEILRIFEEAGILTIERDNIVYAKMGKEIKPISKAMSDIIKANASRSTYNIERLTGTTAQSSENIFINAINKAYLEVSSGNKSYTQVIEEILKEVPKGSSVNYGNGVTRSMESAVRTNIMTATSQTCGELQLMRAKEMDCDLMELTAHIDSRPTHAEWQGQIVSLSGKEGYLSLEDIGYGKIDGFKGINCRHDWYPYYSGIRTYTEEELQEMKNKTVTYNGVTMSYYNATQKQRALERDIRKSKKAIAGYEGFLTQEDNSDLRTKLNNEKNKLRQKNARLNDFLEQTGLSMETYRLII